MKKLFLILAITSIVIASIFTFLPLGSLALIPSVLAVIFSFLYLKKSPVKTFLSKRLMIISILLLCGGLIKTFFVSEEVVIEKEYEEKLENSKKEAIEELEELEIE